MAVTSIAKRRTNAAEGQPPYARLESGVHARAFLPDSRLTFPQVFGSKCARYPDDVAFEEVTWRSGEPTTRPLTFGHLEQHARNAAACLEAAGVQAGDRVLLCLANAGSFFSFLLATQALGAVPVPLPCASDARLPSAFRDRIAAVALDCAPRAIVADDKASLDVVAPGLPTAIALVDASHVHGDSSTAPDSSEFNLERSFDELAFIQYTSGSTGTPKGVVVTHRNLVANVRASAEAGEFSTKDRSVFWLPLYHDMGLVGGLLFGMYLNIPTFVMPTRSFVSRPDSWLRAVGHFKATFTVGPNFAYNLLANRLPESTFSGLDLSCLRLAVNGAEPIDKETVEAFIQRFKRYGFRPTSFYPVYGMAESTLAVAFPKPGAPVRYDTVDRELLSTSRAAVPVAPDATGAVTFVSVGRAMPGHRLVICLPGQLAELPERQLGEVVLSGPSVSPYYFAQGQQPPARTELRTGDLGYIADGELFVVDRVKDLLIIAGRNLVPSDVERVAATVDGVRYGAVVAFGKRGSEGTDELFLVVGAEPHSKVTADGLRAMVGRTILLQFGVTPREVILVKPGKIPKTSSGKIRRSECRRLHEEGAFAEGINQDFPPP